MQNLVSSSAYPAITDDAEAIHKVEVVLRVMTKGQDCILDNIEAPMNQVLVMQFLKIRNHLIGMMSGGR